MRGLPWAPIAIVLVVAPAGAQVTNNPQVIALIGQVQTVVGRLTPLVIRIPPGAQPPVEVIRSRAASILALANAALARAATSRNDPATIAELTSVLAQLQALEPELATVPPLVRDTSFVQRLIVDAGRELDRARQSLAAVPSARAETLFSLAQDALAQARQLQRAGQLTEARQFAERCTRLSREIQHLTADRDELRRRIERCLREIDRLVDLCPPSPKAPLRLKLQEADRFARAAREAYLADSRADALSQLHKAEQLVQAADRIAAGKHGPTPFETRARAGERLMAANSTIIQVNRALGQNAPPLATRTLAGARRYQQRAEDYFARGLYESAEANAHLAQRLANRAGSVRR